jgi:hypothetical protein
MSNNFAIIENGVVVNVVVAEAEYAQQQGWVLCESNGIGDQYVNGQYIRRENPTTPQFPESTKEQLMQELEALAARIQALG